MKSLWIAPERLVLASGSKVRSNILSEAGIPHDTIVSTIDERLINVQMQHTSGPEIAQQLARAKAVDISSKAPGQFILGADQTLTVGSLQFHKAENLHEAYVQLKKLRGKTHQLNSAISLVKDCEILFENVSLANMSMTNFSDKFIDHYLVTAGTTLLSSVGCYQIENLGIQLFEKIDGDLFTIMGLPLLPLLNYMREKGLIVS